MAAKSKSPTTWKERDSSLPVACVVQPSWDAAMKYPALHAAAILATARRDHHRSAWP